VDPLAHPGRPINHHKPPASAQNDAVTPTALPSILVAERDDRALFLLWAAFWLLMALVAVQDSRHSTLVRWWEPLLWEGSSCLVSTGWLLLQRRAARRWEPLLAQPWRWFGRHLAWMPGVVFSFVVLVYAFRHGVYAWMGMRYQHDSWPYLFFYESLKLMLFAGLWLGIVFGLSSFRSWQSERERLLALQRHLVESQLAQLRAQLRPHFLFNALNTISSLMHTDVARADRLLTLLADLLRSSLQAGSRETSTLREETELLALYARIMQERFGDRASLTWALPEELMPATVPTLVLQPLLENAYKHGVERSTTPVQISIRAQREFDRLVITVANDGALADGVSSGIGLRNGRDRLGLFYGKAASLSLSAAEGRVVARLVLPWQPRGS
jgi:two-component sensor histidine kinase